MVQEATSELYSEVSDIQKYIDKGIPEEVAKEVVEELNSLRRLVIIDPLTGLYNRRWLLGEKQLKRPLIGELPRLLDLAKRHKHPLTVFMVDVDGFKQYNDKQGHQKGDEALQTIASILSSNVRKSDSVVRYAGDEFTILLPETDEKGSLNVIKRLTGAMEFNTGEFRQPLGISIGVASYPQAGVSTAEELIHIADQKMYSVKANQNPSYTPAV